MDGKGDFASKSAGQVLDLRRIGAYLAFSFGIAWATALVIYLTGGLGSDSLALIPGTPITVAFVLLPTLYMFSPALAHVLTRLITREGWGELCLRPHLGRAWRLWLLGWLGPIFLTLAGTAIFFALFPGSFDPSFGALREQLSGAEQQAGRPLPLNPGVLIAISVVVAIFVAPIINSLFAFGEEFGWRAYLLPKLLPLGERRTMVIMGVIWGVWHWPLIAMGYEYGRSYPYWPYLGMLVFIWFTLVVGTLLGWLTVRAGSVWPAVIGHATINATAGLGVLVLSGHPSPLLGPSPVGLIGSVAWAAVALWILWRWPRPDRLVSS